MLKADLHIHTEYSIDCMTPLESVISRCLEVGLDCIAISDHGTTEGAMKLKSMAPFYVIVAEEILTPDGEIMGMFLKETIPSGLPIEEAISRIREQDALVCIPHPFSTIARHGLGARMMEKLVEHLDIVEVFNARNLLPSNSVKAQLFAEKYNLPQSAGSDAHTVPEIGNAYIQMPEFNGKDDFLEALKKGTISGQRTNPIAHLRSSWAAVRSMLNRQ